MMDQLEKEQISNVGSKQEALGIQPMVLVSSP